MQRVWGGDEVDCCKHEGPDCEGEGNENWGNKYLLIDMPAQRERRLQEHAREAPVVETRQDHTRNIRTEDTERKEGAVEVQGEEVKKRNHHGTTHVLQKP